MATGLGKPAGVYRITHETWFGHFGASPPDAIWGIGTRIAATARGGRCDHSRRACGRGRLNHGSPLRTDDRTVADPPGTGSTIAPLWIIHHGWPVRVAGRPHSSATWSTGPTSDARWPTWHGNSWPTSPPRAVLPSGCGSRYGSCRSPRECTVASSPGRPPTRRSSRPRRWRCWSCSRTPGRTVGGRAGRVRARRRPDGEDPSMDVTVRRGTAIDAPALARLRWRWRTEERGETGIDKDYFLGYFSGWVLDHVAHPRAVRGRGRRPTGRHGLSGADRTGANARAHGPPYR